MIARVAIKGIVVRVGQQIAGKFLAFLHPRATLLLLGIGLALSSCQVNKYLQPDDQIFGGAKIVLAEGSRFEKPIRVRNALRELVQQDVNSNLGLWAHYALANPDKEKGLRNRLKKRFGQTPVFYEEIEMYRSSQLMRKYLRDIGHFHSEVAFDTIQGMNRVDVVFKVHSEGRFRIRNLTYPKDSTHITQSIRSSLPQSLLRAGDYYQISNLAGERERITEKANNEGYFDFTENDVFYFVDTNVVDTLPRRLDIWLRLKTRERDLGFKQYHIGKTYIYPNYDLSRAGSIILTDTLVFDDISILQNTEIIKPRTLLESVVQQEGDLYSKERQRATSNHFLDLGIYKFVNFKYRRREQDSIHYLDRYLYLTPGRVQNVGAEIGGTTRPGFYGLTIKGSYTHKNIFHGAEQLDLSLSTGFENGGRLLVGDDTLKNNLVEFTARADLSIPRFVIPFVKVKKSSAFHIPRTRISLLANFQRRRRLFTLASFRASLGYDWEETRRKRHQIKLLSINLVDLSGTTQAFENYLSENPILNRSFSDQFILGPSYAYTYTNQEVNKKKNYFFLLGQLETSGNLSYLIADLTKSNAVQPYKIFGTQFSQFTKFDLDLRYNWVRQQSSIVVRFSPGLGIPYLNSEIVPYVKQYYLGGANSLRGFPIRGVLGSFRADEQTEVAQSSFDQTGEIKLEFNGEYRFDLIRDFYLKGALFMDIGNVWLLDPQNLETDQRKVFHGGRFLNELAVGAGVGLRFDIQFIVLRFDAALPFRKPYLPIGQRWTFSDLGTAGWIRENLAFNIALGYPF